MNILGGREKDGEGDREEEWVEAGYSSSYDSGTHHPDPQ